MQSWRETFITSSVTRLTHDDAIYGADERVLKRYPNLSELTLCIPRQNAISDIRTFDRVLPSVRHLRIVIIRDHLNVSEYELRYALRAIVERYVTENRRLTILFECDQRGPAHTTTEIVLLERFVYWNAEWLGYIDRDMLITREPWQHLSRARRYAFREHRVVSPLFSGKIFESVISEIITDIVSDTHSGRVAYHFVGVEPITTEYQSWRSDFYPLIYNLTEELMKIYRLLPNLIELRVPLAAELGVEKLIKMFPQMPEYEFIVSSRDQVYTPKTEKKVTFYRVAGGDIDLPEYPIYRTIEECMFAYN